MRQYKTCGGLIDSSLTLLSTFPKLRITWYDILPQVSFISCAAVPDTCWPYLPSPALISRSSSFAWPDMTYFPRVHTYPHLFFQLLSMTWFDIFRVSIHTLQHGMAVVWKCFSYAISGKVKGMGGAERRTTKITSWVSLSVHVMECEVPFCKINS